MRTDNTDQVIKLRRLIWVAPATVVCAVVAVALVQKLAVSLLPSISPPFRFPLRSREPLVIATVLVTAAVMVFAMVAASAIDPIRTFRRIALGVLLLSFLPNVWVAISWPQGGGPALALAAMHIAAWAVTTTMLSRLTR